MNTTNIIKTAKGIVGRSGLILKKHSPTILTIGGIAVIGAGVVLAWKAGRKHETVKNKVDARAKEVEDTKNNLDEEFYSEEEYKKDRVKAVLFGIGEYTKLYVPAILTTASGITAILVGHKVLKSRNMALVAAFQMVNEAFQKYRKRVIDEYGEETDYLFRTGQKIEETVTKTRDENGKKVKSVEKKVVKINDDGNPYRFFFDEGSCLYKRGNRLSNLTVLRHQQNYANDILNIRGHIFLNEVLDSLGLEHTPAGAVCGWIKNPDQGDNFVDFGVFDRLTGTPYDEFVCPGTTEPSFELTFNVQGVIYDLI